MSKRQPRKKKGVSPKPQKTAKKLLDPSIYEDMNFSWRVSNNYMDYNHPELGWKDIPILRFLKKIVQGLQSYEGLKWREVRCKSHCHPWEGNEIDIEYCRRLEERQILVDGLFQIGWVINQEYWVIKTGVFSISYGMTQTTGFVQQNQSDPTCFYPI